MLATRPPPKKLIDHVKEKYGHLDVLFVNAGIAKRNPSGQVEEEQFDQLFNVNVKGPFFLLKHSVPIMADGGSINLRNTKGKGDEK
ncbi:MAG: SDR family oxidoreductase [Cyanobacteria bacterium REEB67]|nr:SDR family oxidoreductase [Cyanobacteria bacterium REEB67]